MNDLYKALPHLIMATVVIGAVTVLAATGVVTGSEALPVIIGAGSFTLGGTVASSSISAAAGAAASVSHSMQEPATTSASTPTPADTTTTSSA